MPCTSNNRPAAVKSRGVQDRWAAACPKGGSRTRGWIQLQRQQKLESGPAEGYNDVGGRIGGSGVNSVLWYRRASTGSPCPLESAAGVPALALFA